MGALGAITLGAATFWIDASAFAGALAAMLVVFGLAHGDGSWTQTRLLLVLAASSSPPAAARRCR